MTLNMAHLSKLFLASIFSLGITSAASAQVFVGGNGPAEQCYMSAKLGNAGSKGAIRNCKEALEDIQISRKNRVATHINLGILLMRKGDNTTAQTYYKRAIELNPKTPESYINYGASLIYTGQYQEAITSINTAVELGTEKMAEALYNRAMAYNRLENYKGAYKDLKQALVLKPEWPIAVKALENYTVTSTAKTN